jgi:hypothetical protein
MPSIRWISLLVGGIFEALSFAILLFFGISYFGNVADGV